MSQKGSVLKALRSSLDDDMGGDILLSDDFLRGDKQLSNLSVDVQDEAVAPSEERNTAVDIMTNQYMRFEWFEQGYLGDTGRHPAEAEIRRMAITGRMLDGSKGRSIHIDETGRLLDLEAESGRPEVQRVISRSLSILVECNVKESTETDLSRETQRILRSLEEEGVEAGRRVAVVRNILRQLHPAYKATLGSSPRDSVRLLRRRLGWTGAEQLVQSVMGVA